MLVKLAERGKCCGCGACSAVCPKGCIVMEPDKEGFLYPVVDEQECILFDDSPVYCAAAREAGWQVYGVADPVFADRAEEMARVCGPGRFPFSFTAPLP